MHSSYLCLWYSAEDCGNTGFPLDVVVWADTQIEGDKPARLNLPVIMFFWTARGAFQFWSQEKEDSQGLCSI